MLNYICNALHFIKTDIQPCLSKSQKQQQQQPKKVDSDELTSLFITNQHRAIDLIKNDCVDSSVVCRIPLSDLETHFKDRSYRNDIDLSNPPPWEGAVNIEPPAWSPPTTPFTVQEVTKCIKKLPTRKSPGSDGVTYDTLKKRCVKLAPLLTHMFNICLQFKRVPDEWKHGIITLIFKKNGNTDNAEDWRPISLLLSSYKLFMKLVQGRHMTWIVDTGRLSSRQKGSMPRNGLHEQVFIMKTAISDFLHTSSKMYLGFVDIKDAFGSIDHEFMISELSKAGYPSDFIEITKNVYSNSLYQVKTQEGLTNPIIRGKGVIQGCPWSVIVFEQGIDKWLRWIESDYPPLHRPNPVQGYVDDVGMMAIEDKKFESMATKTTGFLDYSGMDAKPRKCAVSCAQRTGNNWKTLPPTIIEIQKNPIPTLSRDELYVYLGHDINLSNTANNLQCDRLVNDFKDNMLKLSRAPVCLAIKLQLIVSMCMSPLLFYFENLHFSEKLLDELETCIVDYVRDWCNLNRSSTRSYMFSPRSSGGLGLPNPRILYYAKHLAFYLSMLNCDDELVRSVAVNSLNLHLSKRKAIVAPPPDPNVNEQQFRFAGYLTDKEGNIKKLSKVNWPKSQWQLLSEQCARAKVELCIGNVGYELHVNIDEDINFRFSDPKTFYNFYKKLCLDRRSDAFRALGSQGRIVSQNRQIDHKTSSCFLFNMNLSDTIKQFVLRGRLQLLECESLLHTYYPLTYSKQCKICRHPSETVSHVLNGCTKFKDMYTKRHNRVLEFVHAKVASAVPKSCTVLKDSFLKPHIFTQQHTDQTFNTTHTRPDMTVVDTTNKRVTLVEISIPFDGFIDQCFQSKFDKYMPLCVEINNLGYRTETVVLVIGSLGNVHTRFISGLIKLGVSRVEAKFLAKYLSVSAIIGSFQVWKARCRNHIF